MIGKEQHHMTNIDFAGEPTFDSVACYEAAERIVLGQYRMTTQGRDAKQAAKDRYDVAVAYIRLYDVASKLLQVAEHADTINLSDALEFNRPV